MSAPIKGADVRGYTVHTHSAGGYSRGCRCEECRTDRAEYVRARRAAAAARRVAAEAEGRVYVAVGIRHGTVSGYQNSSCRCPRCCQAKKEHRVGIYVPAPELTVIPACVRCKGTPSTGACCSSHNALLCHRCYRRTHFVERCGAECERCAREGLDSTKWPAPVAVGGAA